MNAERNYDINHLENVHDVIIAGDDHRGYSASDEPSRIFETIEDCISQTIDEVCYLAHCGDKH